MTAKEALLEAVEQMSEERAAEVLERISVPERVPWRWLTDDRMPLPSEMILMSREELDAVFEKYPPEVDMEENELWEKGTWDSILHIDD